MNKIVKAFSTTVTLTNNDVKTVCKLGQGKDCCSFIAMSADGWECLRMDYPRNLTIFERLDEGTMNAKGQGGWSGCAWEGVV